MEISLSKRLDIENCIIWGDALRVLLNSDQISPGEIKSMLREKGVFIDKIEKSTTVPLLSQMLLTPSEFERLISNSYSREAKLKVTSENLTLVSGDLDWKSAILDNISNINDSIILDDGYSFVMEPAATAGDDGSITISYRVQRESASEEWIAQTLEYEGSISFNQKSGSLVVEATKGYTTKETDRINSLATRIVSKDLKSKGLIKEDEPKGIIFDDFSNEERVNFMLRLTGASHRLFKFEQLIDVDIIRDEAAGPLPDDPDISWMENKVKKLHVNGEKLHEINLVTNKTLHKYCFLTRMSAKYKYNLSGQSGECLVSFWFGKKNLHSSDFSNAEFSFCVESIGRMEKGVESEVRKKIYRKIEDLKEAALNSVKKLPKSA